MFNIGDKLTKENYTAGAIWCNKNGCTINSNWVIEAVVVPEQTRADVEAIRRQLYITEVDPITAHINRLRDEELTPEIASEIAKLVEERKQVVARIKEENPYPAEPIEEIEELPVVDEATVSETEKVDIID